MLLRRLADSAARPSGALNPALKDSLLVLIQTPTESPTSPTAADKNPNNRSPAVLSPMALLQLHPPPLAALGRSVLPCRPFPSATATARRSLASVAFSLQTNVRLLKPNRRSRRSRYPYYDLDDDEEEEDEEYDEDDESEVSFPNTSNHCQVE